MPPPPPHTHTAGLDCCFVVFCPLFTHTRLFARAEEKSASLLHAASVHLLQKRSELKYACARACVFMVATAALMQKKKKKEYIQSRARLPNTGELQRTAARSVCRRSCRGGRSRRRERRRRWRRSRATRLLHCCEYVFMCDLRASRSGFLKSSGADREARRSLESPPLPAFRRGRF